MSNKTILQGHNKALESLKDIVGIPIGDIASALGLTKVETGSFTPASSTQTVNISHSLGDSVRALLFFSENNGVNNGAFIGTGQNFTSAFGSYTKGLEHNAYNMTPTCSENSITLQTSSTYSIFVGGVTYRYILLA